MALPISERRERLLKCLRESFGDELFTAKDVISAKTFGCFDLKDALEANFGTKVLNLKSGLITIKLGRLFEQKCLGKKFGLYELRIDGRGDVNKYRVLGPMVKAAPLFASRPSPPCPGPNALPRKQPPTLTIERVDNVGKVHSEVQRDKNGEPLRDRSADEPIVDKPIEAELPQKDTRPPWQREGRTATRQEWNEWQAMRGATHQQHSGRGDVSSNHWSTQGSITPNRGRFDL